MNRIFFSILAISALVGCAQVPTTPVDVTLIPDDCANRHAIIRWLENVARTPKNMFESEESYEQARSSIKARIWRIRYNCQRV
jgi:hypothetical protein